MTRTDLEQHVEEATAWISQSLVGLSRSNWTGAETLRDAGAQSLLEGIEQMLMERYGTDHGAEVFGAALDRVGSEIGIAKPNPI